MHRLECTATPSRGIGDNGSVWRMLSENRCCDVLLNEELPFICVVRAVAARDASGQYWRRAFSKMLR